MKYTTATVLAGLTAMVNAKAFFTNVATDFTTLQAGGSIALTWDDSTGTGPYTITLKTGDQGNLKDVEVLTTTTDKTFTFTPDSSMASGTYAFQIDDSTGEPNYSTSWTFQSSSPAKTTESAAATTPGASTKTEDSTSSVTGSMTIQPVSNTTTAPTASRTRTPTTTTPASTGTIPDNNSGAMRLASPLALLSVVTAALVFFQ